jgi:hypothetical protein
MNKNSRKPKNNGAKPEAAPASEAGKASLFSTKPEPAKTEPVKTAPMKAATPAIPQPKPQPQPATPVKPAAPTTGHISFELVKPEAKAVCVAGSFNGWKPEQNPLVPRGNGRWVGDLDVKPGRYEYLFVVDGQWLPDPNARETVQNPYGGKNSVMIVSA